MELQVDMVSYLLLFCGEFVGQIHLVIKEEGYGHLVSLTVLILGNLATVKRFKRSVSSERMKELFVVCGLYKYIYIYIKRWCNAIVKLVT